MYRIAVLTIGDEICIGQVINSNAAWIASQCSSLGAHVQEHRVVGDDRTVMLQALRELTTSMHCVLVTGGLGPTHDDITKDVLCEYFDDRLVEDQQTVQHIQELFKARQRMLTDRNKAQALVPSKAQVLHNRLGSAPGLLFRDSQSLVVAMPGVPFEMKAIMNDHVLALIQDEIVRSGEDVMVYSTLFASGIAESSLADLIGDTNELLGTHQLAFLPSYSGVRLRIGAHAATRDAAQNIVDSIADTILQRAGEYIISQGDRSLSSIVHEELIESNTTVAVAESCTAGMLGMQLTEHAGASQYFLGGVQCYSNASKVRDLGIETAIIEQYGAVSRECVEALAQAARTRFAADVGIAISGIAGPDGATPDKPVGTIWIAIADADECLGVRHSFGSDRTVNRERACAAALLMLLRRVQQRRHAKG